MFRKISTSGFLLGIAAAIFQIGMVVWLLVTGYLPKEIWSYILWTIFSLFDALAIFLSLATLGEILGDVVDHDGWDTNLHAFTSSTFRTINGLGISIAILTASGVCLVINHYYSIIGWFATVLTWGVIAGIISWLTEKIGKRLDQDGYLMDKLD